MTQKTYFSLKSSFAQNKRTLPYRNIINELKDIKVKIYSLNTILFENFVYLSFLNSPNP